MIKGFSFNSMKFKMVSVTVVILLLLTAVLGSLSFSQTKPALENAVQETLEATAANIANQIGFTVEKEFRTLDALAQMDVFRSDEVSLWDKCQAAGKVAKIDTTYINIGLYAVDGTSYRHDGSFTDFSGRPYVEAGKRGERTIIDPAVSPVTNEFLMYYSIPIYGYDNEVIDIIAAVVNGARPSELCENIVIGENSHPIIMNMKTGNTIGSIDRSAIESGQVLRDETTGGLQEAINTACSGATGYSTYIDPTTGEKMVASYCPVGGETDWCVFCSAPYNDFFGFMNQMVRSLLISSLIGLLAAIFVTGFIITTILRPLLNVDKSIHQIASGNADLTKRIEQTSKDEIGSVVAGFNKFTERLQTIITQVKNSNEVLKTVGSDMGASTEDTSSAITQIIANIESVHSQINAQSNSVQSTAGAVNEIASNIESLEHMIANQSAGVTQASAAVEEMIGNIASVNQSVDKMAESFDDLQKNAVTGSAKQQDVNERIEQIESQSEMLQEANLAIAAIAEQTNLLAMNAAIEAAHAGDAGKGFSVVADEIRKLSETSTQQSKTIGDQLNSIKESIGSVVQASAESSSAFNNVSTKIKETDQLVRQIKAAMEEQTEGSKQISTALHSMNDSTSEVRVASQEMAEGNKQILEEVRALQDATTVMKQSMDEMSIGARKINETGAALNDMAQKMEQSIGEIGGQIDQFKV